MELNFAKNKLVVIQFALMLFAHTLVIGQIDIEYDSISNYKLKGPVQSLTVKTFNAIMYGDTLKVFEEVQTSSLATKLTFNHKGLREYKAKCNMYGNECEITYDKYDKSLNKISETLFWVANGDTTFYTLQKYEYNPKNDITKRIKYECGDSVFIRYIASYTRDNNGRVIREMKTEADGAYSMESIYEYGKVHDFWLSMKEIDTKMHIDKFETRAFNNKNQLTSHKVFQNEGSKLLFEKNYHYAPNKFEEKFWFNDNGKLKLRAEKTCITNGQKSTCIKIEEKDTIEIVNKRFDATGNLIFRSKTKEHKLANERVYKYNKNKQLVERIKKDYLNGYTSLLLVCYDSLNRVVEEYDQVGAEVIKRWYLYDEQDNWYVKVVSQLDVVQEIEVTRAYFRHIKYFKE